MKFAQPQHGTMVAILNLPEVCLNSEFLLELFNLVFETFWPRITASFNQPINLEVDLYKELLSELINLYFVLFGRAVLSVHCAIMDIVLKIYSQNFGNSRWFCTLIVVFGCFFKGKEHCGIIKAHHKFLPSFAFAKNINIEKYFICFVGMKKIFLSSNRTVWHN